MDQNSLANLLAAKFISRKEVKAVQRMLPTGDCIYTPHCRGQQSEQDYLPWDRASLLSHIAGEKSFGHYLLNTDNECKFFAFDVDLEKKGAYPVDYPNIVSEDDPWACAEFNPREAWKDRRHPARPWMKMQLRMMAGLLANAIYTELEIPVAAYYSGSKGIHVYGFTGLAPASEVREAARLVLETMDCWEPFRGDTFYHHKDKDPVTGYPNLSIEVFPKQDSITDKSGLGNLMRVVLGKNLKNPKDPTFFIDLRNTNMGQLVPVDPEWALTTANPWAA